MNQTIGEKIAMLRKEKQITQTELAEYLFLTPQTVSRWEVGNGTPEITLLPKIAAFFGVSIDELFGMTSVNRARDLVSKYSVLRDDGSFQEAMECVNSQIQTIDAAIKNNTVEISGLKDEKEELETLKLHLWVQQGREAFQRALTIAEAFVEKSEGNPDDPWYLRMRLQKNQLCVAMNRGREALAECKRNFAKNPNGITLNIYFHMLIELQNYEEILSLYETESSVKQVLFPPAWKNLGAWWTVLYAAEELGEAGFVEKQIDAVLATSNKEDEYIFLNILKRLYEREDMDSKIPSRKEKLEEVKNRIRSLIPELPFNQYALDGIKKSIE